MKVKIILAFLFLFIGAFQIFDWIFFTLGKDNLSFDEVKRQYLQRVPAQFAHIYSNKIRLIAFLLFVLLAISAVIFFSVKNKFYRLLGIVAALLGFWQLFSLM